MKEKKAQYIMSKYLEKSWGVRLDPNPGGADFRHKGNAIEVKGSGFRVSQAVNQFSRYATEFNKFGIAFPTDALNATNLFHLHVLGTIWYPTFNKFLYVYLIFEEGQKYGIMEITDASNVLRMILDEFNEILKIWEADKIKKLLNRTELFIRKLNTWIRVAARRKVESDPNTIWIEKLGMTEQA